MPRQRRSRIALSEGEQEAIGRAIANPPSDRVRKRAEALLGLYRGERIAEICCRVGVGRSTVRRARQARPPPRVFTG